MSLINEMLRNLDRRCARVTSADLDSLPLAADELEASSPRGVGSGIAVAAACGAAFALTLVWSAATRPTVAATAVVTAALPPAPLPDVALAPIVPPEPARVDRLALAELASGTRLEVRLSRSTGHRVEASADGRAVELRLEDTELGPDLAELELRGTPVQAFEVERADGELRIRLTTSKAVKARSMMRGDDSAANLEVDLLAEAPDPAPAAEPEERAVATQAPRVAGRATGLWRQALRRAGRGDDRGAESALLEALKLAPENVGVRSALIALLLRGGRLDEAEAQIAVGRTKEGDAAAYAALAARALLARGDAVAALAELEASPPPIESSLEHHALLAAVRERLGHHAAAAETYTALLGLDAKRADWWMGLALAREAEGKGAEALNAYRSAGRLSGLSPEASRWVRERATALALGG